jgi:hypothetical protein
MKKILTFLCLSVLAALSVRASVLFQDSTNYPYTDGCIEGQGQWYCYSPFNTTNFDAFVTNDVLLLNTTNKDSVGTPTNGWANNPGSITYASFSINVSQLPATANGGYFCQFQDSSNHDVCHIYIDTRDTSVPGTYRLGIANFDTSFSTIVPPVNFPLDLSPGITYNVVFAYDTDQNSPTVGSTLLINPSYQDYQNFISDADGNSLTYFGQSYVFPTDTTSSSAQLGIQISQIGFSPYANAGISNVIVGSAFTDVNTTNPPLIGIQPQSVTNYSGNGTTFYTAASGVDLTYQWYSSGGPLTDDNVNIFGSSGNILVLTNLSATDTYYVIVTDAYGNTATSATATNTVITTPTAPFFPPSSPGQASTGGLKLTNNLFTAVGFTNLAFGSGPLSYQWYFAPTNIPTTYAPLSGQTTPGLTFSELEYPNAGSYYVVASNVDGITPGPTNSLTVVAPLVATLPQLHTLMGLIVTNITGANIIPINTNGVSVTGYVTTFGPLTASTKTFSEFYIGYQGYGIYVFYGSAGTNAVPAPGSYVTVTGPCQVYHGQLEIDPGTNNGVVISNTLPKLMPPPQPGNFAQLATNALGAYGVQSQCSLITFTNVYIYGSKTGSVFTANGGKFFTNSFTALYMTQGPFSRPNNTNVIELYVPAYGYGSISTNIWGQPVSTNAYEVTGVMENFSGASELCLTRLDDLVTNTPSSFPVTLSRTNAVSTVTWPIKTGSTYSIYSATNAAGPWTNLSYGYSYFPTNGTYLDTNRTSVKFYKISTP